MSRLPDLCSDAALRILRFTIQEAQGNEVFFLGTTDETGVLQEVDPLARGNDSAVPALLQVASQGDVILHNHPSGHLVPSEADLELAAHYGNQGVGFYIVNNSVDKVYVVVEAFEKPASPTLEVSEILQLFAPGGALAKRFSDYQHRPAQQGMAETVAETFNQSRVALIEAATGTGKSLAYLIPAILWAARNRQRVVVSTNTINLQEQLIHKDIPLLQQVLDCEFNAVLVKGRSNYLCLDKLQALDRQGKLFLEEEWADFIALSRWARQTSDGSRSDLSLNVSSALWEKVACESDTCTRIK
ncbi:MAG: DEAD/DEAH box helicase [Acidobacteria bacterium]|nr:DEAD/DEAH box helicase [Acidobacteriota bacterium]